LTKITFHLNEIPWQTFTEKKWGTLRWKELLNQKQGGSMEFIFGLAELPVGGVLPLHAHQQAETDYILSGKARFRLGLRSLESGPRSALYFPCGAPHSIENLGSEPFRYIYTYACEALGQPVDSKLVDQTTANQVDIVNKGNKRWAIREEVEPWYASEVSKGLAHRIRDLFDIQHGGTQEMLVGIAELDPGIHYTLHYHEQPEIYFVTSGGRGVIYVDDKAYEATPGSAFYIGKRVPHGMDSIGKEVLRVYYVYGTETTGQEDSWTPVEDIYDEVRWRR
jgi:mannose-6-phosphate isomerase-like protein (cupin superfamily)